MGWAWPGGLQPGTDEKVPDPAVSIFTADPDGVSPGWGQWQKLGEGRAAIAGFVDAIAGGDQQVAVVDGLEGLRLTARDGGDLLPGSPPVAAGGSTSW
jgi:hypothetical protein